MAAPSVTGEEVHSDQQSDEGNGTPVDAHSTSVFPVNRLCDGEACTILDTFDFDANSTKPLGQSLGEYLEAHGARSGIEIGTFSKILKRQDSCPFCRFVTRWVSDSSYAEVSGDALFYLRYASGINIGIGLPDYEPIRDIKRPGEDILVVEPARIHDRLTSRPLSSRISYDMVYSWLGWCHVHHTDICPVPPGLTVDRDDRPSTLRVFDVVDFCLKDISWYDKYAALSYVWGRSRPPKLFSHNLQKYYTPGALRQLEATFPQTTRDSITLVSGLDIRYLWFDSLCLVQDILPDLRLGIQNMDSVYEGACVTIVAANAASADCGLPGVGKTPRNLRGRLTEVLTPCLQLVKSQSTDMHINASVYGTRGWTMQEQHLSRRALIFAPDQLHFRSRTVVWSEESPEISRSEIMNYLSIIQAEIDLGENPATPTDYFADYTRRYQGRALSDEKDTINAVSGILQRIVRRLGGGLLAGIPTAIFPLALIYTTSTIRFERSVRRRYGFPSWSWAAWSTPILRLNWEASDATHGDQDQIVKALSLMAASFYNYAADQTIEMIWPCQPSMVEQICPAFRRQSELGRRSIEISTTKPYPLPVVDAITVSLRIGN